MEPLCVGGGEEGWIDSIFGNVGDGMKDRIGGAKGAARGGGRGRICELIWWLLLISVTGAMHHVDWK